MSLFGKITKSIIGSQQDKPERGRSTDHLIRHFIDYGDNTLSGDHDHRTNKGGDRTPSQKKGDQKRRKTD